MFGLALNHGTLDNRPYPYVRAEASNRDFVSTLEELLRQIWCGHINARNTSGENTTDDAVIADLALQLQEMLNERRIHGNLSREEFVAVCTMSWFHLALAEPDSPIVRDLKADATTPDARLRKLGERVGLASHSKSRSLLSLAEPISTLLIEVERGVFSDPANASLLYDPARADNIASDTLNIIHQWSVATGHDPKATPVTFAR
jgi:hypothetical protein